MTPEQIQLVHDTVDALAGIDDRVARAFYDRLFEVAPAVRPLFPDDLDAQAHKFVVTLEEIVRSVSDLPDFVARARDLGARHVGYHARASHYVVIGDVLFETLAQELGDRFTSEHEAAWRRAYHLLAEVMQEGADAELRSRHVSPA